MRKLLALVASLAAIVVLALPAIADDIHSGTLPPFPACHPALPANAFGPGQPPVAVPSTGPCTETDHFGVSVFASSGGGPCGPAFDTIIFATGNGIAHITVNSADDFWITQTFEGDAKVFKLLGFNADGTPNLGELVATGHEMTWFGGSFNSQNFVIHDVGNVNGTTVTGLTIDLHFADHASSTGGNPFLFLPVFPPPNAHLVWMKSSC